MNDFEPVPQKKSTNIWKWIGLGCGGVFLVFLALGAGLIYFVQRSLNLSLDSNTAVETTQKFMDYQIPGGAKGLVKMNAGGVEMAGVTSASNPRDIILMLGQIPSEVVGQNEEIPKTFESQFKQQYEQQGYKFTTERSESKQLCGQPVNVTILEGENTFFGLDSAVPALSYQTAVNHNNRVIYISLLTSGQNASTNATSVFNSLKCK